MDNTEISGALAKFNYSEITTQQLAEHMGFTPEEQKMLKLFWEPTFNQGWIYLSPEMITGDMGYKKLSNFYADVLRPNYIEGIDYIEIEKDDDLVRVYDEYKESFAAEISAAKNKDKRGGSNAKYYKITGKTFKKMLMKCGTKKGDQICEYYLKTEQLAIVHDFKKIANTMTDYINALHAYLLQQQMAQINEEKNRIHNVNIELLSYKKLTEKNEIIYIVSTYRYASQGIYKIGRTKCMKTRLSGHNNTNIVRDFKKIVNCDRVVSLKEFKVNDSVSMENYIHRKLRGLLVKDEKEFFMCPFDLLENLLDIIINDDDRHNEIVNKIVDTVNSLRCSSYSPSNWMTGLDPAIFNETYTLTNNVETKAEFNITVHDFFLKSRTD